jgi:hypothetical protein
LHRAAISSFFHRNRPLLAGIATAKTNFEPPFEVIQGKSEKLSATDVNLLPDSEPDSMWELRPNR